MPNESIPRASDITTTVARRERGRASWPISEADFCRRCAGLLVHGRGGGSRVCSTCGRAEHDEVEILVMNNGATEAFTLDELVDLIAPLIERRLLTRA